MIIAVVPAQAGTRQQDVCVLLAVLSRYFDINLKMLKRIE
jgi:hypothetical protein